MRTRRPPRASFPRAGSGTSRGARRGSKARPAAADTSSTPSSAAAQPHRPRQSQGTARQATGSGQVFIGDRKIGGLTGTHTRPAVDVGPVDSGGVAGQWCFRQVLGACPA